MRIIKDSSQGVLVVPFKTGRQLKMCVTVMLAFDLGKQNQLFDEQQMWNHIMSVSEDDIFDAGLPKGRAEWLLKGHAYSGEKARSIVRVGCGVAGKNKRLDIYGERQWNGNDEASEPKLFMKMPVSRELACGNEMIPDRDNNDHALKPASIFYPGDIQSSRSQSVKSAGFLPLSMLSSERQCYAGTYNDNWLRNNWPGYPDDFDYRYFNVAPVDQRLSEWLPHGSCYHLVNLHPESGEITGATPTYNVRAFARHTVNMKTLFSEIILHCDTLWFFPDVNTGVTLYRGVLNITDDEAQDVDTLVLGLEPPGSVPLKIEEYFKKCDDKNNISTSTDAAYDADSQQKEADAKLDYARKIIQDIPKFYTFKSEQLQGNIPVPVIPLSCIGSIASTVFDQQAKISLPVSLDKYHVALSKQQAICRNVVNELSKADAKSKKALEQMREEAKSNGLSGDDYNHCVSSVNIFPVMENGSGCWSDQAGHLVAKAQAGLDQKKSECDNYGLRPLSCQRYMLGYLPEAVVFNAEEWHINTQVEREYIGPGWVLPTYTDGIFVSLIIRPHGLNSIKGAYQVQGSSVSHWRSGSENATAIVAVDLLSACLLAQDMDEFMQVFWISSPDEKASAVLKNNHMVILPVPDEEDKKNRLEPWLPIHKNIIPWVLPEGVSSLKEFLNKNMNIRDWLALFLDQDKTSVNQKEMINMIMNNQVNLIKDKSDNDFLEAEKLINEHSSDDELKQNKIQALGSVQSDFQTVLSQQTVPEFKSPEIISSDMKQVAARIENTIDKIKEENSCFSEAGKSVNTLNSFKDEMIALVKKNSPQKLFSSSSSSSKQLMDKQNNGFRRLSRKQLEDAYDKGKSLHKLDLSGMDLKGINLKGADLSSSLLQNTDLSGSDLSGCILQFIIAQKVNLSGSNLEKCNFNKALLEEADLCGCHGAHAIFSSAQLSGAVLSDADFSMGVFKSTLLEKANLTRCILYRSNLQGVMAMNADFTLADLRQCYMKDCILNNAVLIQADLQQVYGEKASFWGVNGREMNLTKAELPNVRFGPAQLQNACLREADLFRINLMEADLSEAIFEQANLDEAFINQTDLSRANLHNAELKRGQLIRSNLTGACLRGANLMQSALIKTSFIAADLSESCLFNADIRKITLGNTDLEKINIKKTILAGKIQGLQAVNHGN